MAEDYPQYLISNNNFIPDENSYNNNNNNNLLISPPMESLMEVNVTLGAIAISLPYPKIKLID